jgi:hypothetical protein
MKSGNAQKCATYRAHKKAVVQHQVEVPTTAGLLRVKHPAIVIDSDAEVKDKASNLLIHVWKDKVTLSHRNELHTSTLWLEEKLDLKKESMVHLGSWRKYMRKVKVTKDG